MSSFLLPQARFDERFSILCRSVSTRSLIDIYILSYGIYIRDAPAQGGAEKY